MPFHYHVLMASNRRTSRIRFHFMAVSHKDWGLQNSRILFAEIGIDRGLDFQSHLDRHLDWLRFGFKKLQTKMQKYWLSSSNIRSKPLMRKKKLERTNRFSSALHHRRSQAKCQLIKTSYTMN